MSNEIYVYSEGEKPRKVIQGREAAVRELIKDFHTTPKEKKQLAQFLEGNVCELYTGIHLVGFPPEVPDRRLTRVLGPGSNE